MGIVPASVANPGIQRQVAVVEKEAGETRFAGTGVEHECSFGSLGSRSDKALDGKLQRINPAPERTGQAVKNLTIDLGHRLAMLSLIA